jgi:hypothetical protein
MKNIPPSVLPNFFGLSTEDLDAFMFEFCWQPIHIFHYLISCLHQCFTNIDFPSQISNERRPYSLRLFDRLSSLNLRNCKHENFSFRGHILNHYLNCRYLLCHHAYCAYLFIDLHMIINIL